MSQHERTWLAERHSVLEQQGLRLSVLSTASLQLVDKAEVIALAVGGVGTARFRNATATQTV